MINYSRILQTGEWYRGAWSKLSFVPVCGVRQPATAAYITAAATCTTTKAVLLSLCRYPVAVGSCMWLGLWEMGGGGCRAHSSVHQHAGAAVLHSVPPDMAAGSEDRHAAGRELEVGVLTV